MTHRPTRVKRPAAMLPPWQRKTEVRPDASVVAMLRAEPLRTFEPGTYGRKLTRPQGWSMPSGASPFAGTTAPKAFIPESDARERAPARVAERDRLLGPIRDRVRRARAAFYGEHVAFAHMEAVSGVNSVARGAAALEGVTTFYPGERVRGVCTGHELGEVRAMQQHASGLYALVEGPDGAVRTLRADALERVL
jgi:hypothetical protein